MSDPVIPQSAPTEPINTDTSVESSEESNDSNTLESSPEGQAAAASTPVKEMSIKKALRKLSLKVDGKDINEDLPFDLPDDPAAVEYMRRELQLSKMGQKRAQHASTLEKEIKSFVEELRKNPRAVLSDPTLGVDLKNLAKQVIEEEIANSKKTPDQLEREKLENELKSLKEQQLKDKKDSDDREFQRLQQSAHDEYDMKIGKALESSELPKSPYVVKKMAEYLLLGLQNGLDLSPEDVLPLVRDEIQGDLKEMFQVMPDEVVEQMVGRDKLNSIRKKSVARAKIAPPAPISKAIKDTGKSAPKADKPADKKTFKQFFGV